MCAWGIKKRTLNYWYPFNQIRGNVNLWLSFPLVFLRQTLGFWGLFSSLPIREKEPTVYSLGRRQHSSSHYAGKRGFVFPSHCPRQPGQGACFRLNQLGTPSRAYNLFKKFFIGVWLIYNVMLVSGVQQSESIIHIHISTLFKILFPYRPLRSIE